MPHLGSRRDGCQGPPGERGPSRPGANRGATKQAEGHKTLKAATGQRGYPPGGAHDCTARAAHTARQRPRSENKVWELAQTTPGQILESSATTRAARHSTANIANHAGRGTLHRDQAL